MVDSSSRTGFGLTLMLSKFPGARLDVRSVNCLIELALQGVSLRSGPWSEFRFTSFPSSDNSLKSTPRCVSLLLAEDLTHPDHLDIYTGLQTLYIC